MVELNKYFKSKRYKNTKERIRNAFAFTNRDFNDVPIIIHTAIPSATGQDHEKFPKDYYTNPESMMKFQTEGFEKHLEKIDDDFIPFLTPWYGVCVVPDYFGSKIIFPKNGDPAAFPTINTIEKAKNLITREFKEADLMNRVIATIDYFKKHSDYPVSVTDSQGTLNCINQIIGYENLFYWMKDDPKLVDYLLGLINDTVIKWTKFQKRIIGEKNNSTNGIISIRPPDGIGAWFSDDDLTILSPDLYEKFIVEKYNKLFRHFGKSILHWCGNGNHQLDNIVNIKGIGGVHNFFLGDIDSAVIVQQKLAEHKIVLISGDMVPVDEEIKNYCKLIKENLSPVGLVLNFWIYPKLGLKNGKYVYTERDVIDNALRILNYFRG